MVNIDTEYEYITRDALYRGHRFPQFVTALHKNWVNMPYTMEIDGEQKIILPRYELKEYIQSLKEVEYSLYQQIIEFKESFTLENASPLFANVLGDYLQFISILENDYIQANVIKSFNAAYSYAGSTFSIVKLAKIIFGEQVEISFFLEETPKRIVFGNIALRQNMILSTPLNEALATPDLYKIVASNVSTVGETIPVLNAFFQKFTMANYATVFEFNL